MAKLTTEEFIKRAREVHGDKYDYSMVDYVKPYQSRSCKGLFVESSKRKNNK